MDLLHEEELTGMKTQYAVTMVAVSVATYAVAVGLVVFVDRQKIKPLLDGLLAQFSFLGYKLQHPFDEKAGPAAESAAETTDKDDDKTSRAAASKPWAALRASLGLHLPQRRKKKKEKGKAAEVPELGLALDALEAAGSTYGPGLVRSVMKKAGRRRNSNPIRRQDRTPSPATPDLPGSVPTPTARQAEQGRSAAGGWLSYYQQPGHQSQS